MEVIYICPACLNYENAKDSKTIECEFCGATMKSSGMIRASTSAVMVQPFEDKLRQSPEFNQALFEARIRQFKRELAQQAKEREQQKREEAKMVHCPACGSTQIQMVPRKWSLLAGFATNKVDRVCVKCKKKF